LKTNAISRRQPPTSDARRVSQPLDATHIIIIIIIIIIDASRAPNATHRPRTTRVTASPIAPVTCAIINHPPVVVPSIHRFKTMHHPPRTARVARAL
jgi:hypothetical protein